MGNVLVSVPGVTVILPMFNREKSIGDAVQSILDQTFPDFELIVVDDGSTDHSLDVLRAFQDARLVILSHPRNCGYGAAMNTGIARARGKYIARMDSDDVSKPKRLEKQVRFLDEHPDFVMVGTLFNNGTLNGEEITRLSPSGNPWLEETWETIMDQSRRFADPSVMFRTQSAVGIGGYRNYQTSGMDVDFWLRLLEGGGRAAVINEVLYTRRIVLDSLTIDPMTLARNQIPRLLARERRERGNDRVMRGESIENLVTPEMVQAAKHWTVRRYWRQVEICFEVQEWGMGIYFAQLAVTKDKFNKLTLQRFMRALRYAIKGLITSF